ncbi:MAG: MFS transporter [Cyanobacteria bacterium]|nr:MFS transporter [Cyanobacteriota bacterium]
MESAPQAIDETKLLAKVSWRLIPFMLILYIVSYLDRINISFAALQMNKDLGFTDEAFGFGAGIFFFGYCAFGIPSNLVIEKWGARRWISLIMVIWGFMTISFCLVKDSTQFFILRFCLGLAEAGFFPGMIYYLTQWFPPRHYGAAVARFMVAIPIAGALGSLVAAQALSIDGAMGIRGWMWLFIITGIPAIVLGVTVLFLMPDRPHQARWLSREEADFLTASVGSGSATSSTAETKSALNTFFDVLAQATVWRFALLYFSLTVSMYGFQLWLPQIIKAFEKQSDSMVALISIIPAIFQALGMVLVAGSSDRSGERRFHVVAAAGCTIAGLLLCISMENPYLKMAGLCVAAFGIWGSVGPFWALTRDCVQRQHQATGIALINSVGNLGGFAGPYIVGLVKQYSKGFGGSLIALAVASVLAAILAATTVIKKPESVDG